MSTSHFYRAFEDRHRGSRELIAGRLAAYLPFVLPLLGVYRPAAAVDLGCGRGEWLELLGQHGFETCGVDLDAGMLSACTERGLTVVQQDALDYLNTLPDESQTIVSGFHIVEHIPFESLDAIVRQAKRVLKPGGLLILETPNPENLVVGTNSFYLDPTHVRPIPPLLLAFLPEHYGFARVRTVRLQEQPGLMDRPDITLMDVLGGVSPDYSVVAQKAAAAEVMDVCDASFAAQHGIDLYEIASRFDQKIKGRMNTLDDRLTHAEKENGAIVEALGQIGALQDRLIDATSHLARVEVELRYSEAREKAANAQAQEQRQRAEAIEAVEDYAKSLNERAADLETQVQGLQTRVDELGHASHQWRLRSTQLESERNALRQSLSWRITGPLRFVGGLFLHPGVTIRFAFNHMTHCGIELAQRPLARLMSFVLRRPHLSQRVNRLLMRYPALYQQLLGVAHRQGVVPSSLQYVPPVHVAPLNIEADLEHLSPRARQIYANLITAVERKK